MLNEKRTIRLQTVANVSSMLVFASILLFGLPAFAGSGAEASILEKVRSFRSLIRTVAAVGVGIACIIAGYKFFSGDQDHWKFAKRVAIGAIFIATATEIATFLTGMSEAGQ